MSSRHQFHLRWSNYGHNLANSFVRLFESESLADVTLFCEGESYRAHRVVLAASSVHFQELFEQCSSAQNLVVILDGTSPANLRALLEFMYKGEVYIDDANLNSFLQTAKRLQVKGLSLSQSDLHSISNDAPPSSGQGQPSSASSHDDPNSKGDGGNGGSNNLLAQALGPQGSGGGGPNNSQQGGGGGKPNNGQSPPTSFSSPSPSQTPPHPPSSAAGMYGDDKHRKKFRLSSPKQSSPEGGGIPEGLVEYGSSPHHPPRPNAPAPSPSLSSRIIEMDQRATMVPGFPAFAPIYPTSGGLGPPPSPQGHGGNSSQQQGQTIVITENPNIRKIRSASTENTMPEDLSIKLEVGRDEEMGMGGGSMGGGGKQRSFSMDLSPSDPLPFGPMGGGGGGPGPSVSWSLPSPSAHLNVTQHDIDNAQSTPDGKLMNGKKLKCPFCERLYGYETNLRAHIRQRHQGIRVPCPFCTRTFTRNNTVRRHVAREHRALLGGVRSFHHPLSDPGQGFSPGGPGGNNSQSPNQGSPNNAGMSGGGLMSGGGVPHPHHGMGGPPGGASAAAVAAAVAAAAAQSNLQLPPGGGGGGSPPLSSGSGGSGGRPSSRSSAGGGGSKPVD